MGMTPPSTGGSMGREHTSPSVSLLMPSPSQSPAARLSRPDTLVLKHPSTDWNVGVVLGVQKL
jgi:hypothetical protein